MDTLDVLWRVTPQSGHAKRMWPSNSKLQFYFSPLIITIKSFGNKNELCAVSAVERLKTTETAKCVYERVRFRNGKKEPKLMCNGFVNV